MEQTTIKNEYETICILQPGLNEEETTSLMDQNSDTIQKEGGEVLKKDNWGLKKLAYEINKHPKGIYTYHLFNGNGDIVKELERLLNINENVLKFMTVRLDPKKKRNKPSTDASSQSQ